MQEIIVSEEINIIAKTLKDKFPVKKVILFGSRADGDSRKDSDIDLCVIVNNLNKRRLDLIRQMRRELASVVSSPMDILVYSVDEFNSRAGNRSTLEHTIKNRGLEIYG